MIEDPNYTPPASKIPRLTEKPVFITQEESSEKENSASSELGIIIGAVAGIAVIVTVLSVCLCFNGFCCVGVCQAK